LFPSWALSPISDELYIKEYDYIIDAKLKEQLKTLQSDDNPVIRICRADNASETDE